MIRRTVSVLLLAALPPVASAGGFECRGEAPDWRLSLDADTATLVFPAPTAMEVMLETRPQGADWPRAFTLVGARDTAIVLVEREACGALPYRARVFTQRGQTPMLLTGCCEAAE